jgi:DNA adenine methylase
MEPNIRPLVARINKRSDSGKGALADRKRWASRAVLRASERARIAATTNVVRAGAGATGRAAVPAGRGAAPAPGLQRPELRAIHTLSDPAPPRYPGYTLDAEPDDGLSQSSKRFKGAAGAPALPQGPRPSVGTAVSPALDASTALLSAACLPPPTPGGARGAEEDAAALQEVSLPGQAQVGLKRKAADAAAASLGGWACDSPVAVPAASVRVTNAVKRSIAGPALKWAGGKTQLLVPILERLPRKIGDYYEPFLGGAAVLIALLRAGRISGRVLAGDANPHLVATYIAIRDDVETLVHELKALMAGPCDEATYKARRAQFNKAPRPALFLFLNATCWHGLYRENLKGKFNTPFEQCLTGKTVTARAANLRALSTLFQKHRVEFVTGSWATTLASAAGEGATVYLDPPYVPLTSTTFTDYTAGGFKEHEAVLKWARGTKARVLYSNHATPAVVGALAGWDVEHIEARRCICSNKPNARAKEILASNF